LCSSCYGMNISFPLSSFYFSLNFFSSSNSLSSILSLNNLSRTEERNSYGWVHSWGLLDWLRDRREATLGFSWLVGCTELRWATVVAKTNMFQGWRGVNSNCHLRSSSWWSLMEAEKSRDCCCVVTEKGRS